MVCVEVDIVLGCLVVVDVFVLMYGYVKVFVNVCSDFDLLDGVLDDLFVFFEVEVVLYVVDYDLLIWWDDVFEEWFD